MNSSKMFTISLILILLCDSAMCYECDFFKNITVRASPVVPTDTITAQRIIIDGCFGPENFEEMKGLVAFGEDNIKYIGDHAVHDLLTLTQVIFMRCSNIEEISAHAFENLPNLDFIKISHTKITSIPAGTFKNLPSLNFLELPNNNISEISREAFGVQPSLEYVILRKNNIRTIDHLWFRNCPNLHYISFDYNNIEVISKNTFQFMPNLKELLLDFNEIGVIEEMSFHHFEHLEVLSLVHNKLVHLDPNIIKENFKVRVFDINANFLSFLSQDLLTSVNELRLSGNPLECACLDQIREWADQANVALTTYCRTENIPQCFNGTDPSICSQANDPNNTELFLKELKDLEFPIQSHCANFS